MFRITLDNLLNKDSHNTTNSYNTTFNTYVEDQWRVLRWLSPLQPWERHNDVASARAEGIGEWVLKTPEFRAWQRRKASDESVDAALFCCGAPGAGKTYICSLVIDTLFDTAEGSLVVGEPAGGEIPHNPNVGVACLYGYYGSQKEQTATSMLGAILKQFVMALPEIPEVVFDAFRAAKGRSLRLPKLVELLHQVLGEFRQTFICVDALDELELAQRLEFLRSLKQIVKKSPTTQLFLTGRPHIRPELDKHLTSSAGFIIAQPSKDDIKKFVAMKLDTDPESEIMTEELRSEIMSYIPEYYSQIFLLAVLHIDAVLGEMTVFARRRMLYETKNSLSNAYSGTVERLKQQSGDKARMGMGVLTWISLAERPLHVDELCHALGVDLGTTCLDVENIPQIEVLLRCCLGLVTVDRETSTVRLVHATLQEYLRSHLDIFYHPHKIIAEVCLTYLNFELVKRLPLNIIEAPEEFPLLQYASRYWGIHLREEQEDLTEPMKALAVELLGEYDTNTHVSLSLFLRGEAWNRWDPMPATASYTGLHYVAALGITEIAVVLLQMGNRDLNLRDPQGRTPLAWAAMNGQDEIVKLLLNEKEISPDVNDKLFNTPLSWAARNGHEKVVKMLLGRPDVSTDEVNYVDRTALSYAAEKGHEGVVKLLLDQKAVDPNSTDNMGRTPLSWAARGGHKRVIELLLQKPDVDPDLFDKDDRTPLSWAAEEGHEGVVGLLLNRSEVRPDRVDKHGDSPISRAFERGQEKIARLFLDRADINPELVNSDGRTLLSLAAGNGDENLVKILLECPKVDPNSVDARGQTPLLWASVNGNERVVQQLLSLECIRPDIADESGRTPLSRVAGQGYMPEGTVRLLLARPDVDPNSIDHNGRTPLLWAAESGRLGVVRLLLDHPDVDPNRFSFTGQTPLYQASVHGHELIVELLLQRDDVNADQADSHGNTPLSQAAKKGHEDIVAMLLKSGKATPDPKNKDGRTPLSLAAGEGNAEVVEILMGHGGVDPYSRDNRGQTPLSWAEEEGWDGVVGIIENYASAEF